MTNEKKDWLSQLGGPGDYAFRPSWQLLKTYHFPEFDAELCLQANGPGTFQRVLTLFPLNLQGKAAAVAVPFYFPEAMLGFELDSEEPLARYKDIEMMLHLVRRGFIAASADAYHLTFRQSTRERDDFSRWPEAAYALLSSHPQWSGIGKLATDTRLLVDSLANDPRVEPERIGIAGHSLGGKMAFYAGCLDSRIQAILVSDFGFLWEQTNWEQAWYWGDKLPVLKKLGFDHSGLLSVAAPKPFFLLAGEADDDRSLQLMQQAAGYNNHPERLGFLNHASGHRPPLPALEQGYKFLEKWL